ncbi:hypothetical protein BC332_11314 [Capsicum chinense]|nr:hypothetical protein BC332_11314 [Capsicum chinense]
MEKREFEKEEERGRRGKIGATRSNKESKSNKSTTHIAKPTVKKKTLVKKKAKPEATVISNTSNLTFEANGPMESPKQLICQQCPCALKHVGNEFGFANNGHDNRVTPILKLNKASKSRQQGDISQSSKSSIGDYNCSTTISDESNLSGFIIGNRPHMPKDRQEEDYQSGEEASWILRIKSF